jgi:hypothetical protein
MPALEHRTKFTAGSTASYDDGIGRQVRLAADHRNRQHFKLHRHSLLTGGLTSEPPSRPTRFHGTALNAPPLCDSHR